MTRTDIPGIKLCEKCPAGPDMCECRWSCLAYLESIIYWYKESIPTLHDPAVAEAFEEHLAHYHTIANEIRTPRCQGGSHELDRW